MHGLKHLVNLAEENKFIRDRNEKIDISHNIYDNVSDRLSNVKCQMSFMYILNKRGPRMDPCGIPESVFDHRRIFFYLSSLFSS